LLLLIQDVNTVIKHHGVQAQL